MKKAARILSFLLLFISLLPLPVHGAAALIPGGQLIGMELCGDGLTVAALHDTLGDNARSAGLQPGDRLLRLNGKALKTTADIRQALDAAGKQVTLTVERSGKQLQLKLAPVIVDGQSRLGVYLKKGIHGIGTVTYYNPDTGTFGALGHGVNTPDGKLLTLEEGTVYDADILRLRKGESGNPGQLMGTLTDTTPIGTLDKNAPQGVFGRLDVPMDEALPVAQPTDIRTGSAVIRSTVCSDGVQEYSVEILKIYPNSDTSGRNMLLRITDPRLLDTTGGIVQGMSGSPVLQDGRIVGAVTHVLVNDPTMGYGIFIENMLEAAG